MNGSRLASGVSMGVSTPRVDDLPEEWPDGVVAKVNSVAPASPAAGAVSTDVPAKLLIAEDWVAGDESWGHDPFVCWSHCDVRERAASYRSVGDSV